MAEIELKPCPFCGGKVIAVYKSQYGGFFAQCCECGAEVGSPNSEETTKAWNRRI